MSISKFELEMYRSCMQEINHRMDVIDNFLSKRTTSGFFETNVEMICLQFRKILELIALSSLVSNKKEYSRIRPNFHTDWKANRILETLEKINPDFYPKPIEYDSFNPMTITKFSLVFDGFLSKNDFLSCFNEVQDFLHAENPFSQKKNIRDIHSKFISWYLKIDKLLNKHLTKLADRNVILITHMNESNTKLVKVYTLTAVR